MKPKNIETSYGKFPTMIHYENYWKDKVSKTFSDGQDDILNTLKSFDWKGKDVPSTKGEDKCSFGGCDNPASICFTCHGEECVNRFDAWKEKFLQDTKSVKEIVEDIQNDPEAMKQAKSLIDSEDTKEVIEYKCGHKPSTIILDCNELSMFAWYEWKDSVGWEGDKSQCWECWCKKDTKSERCSRCSRMRNLVDGMCKRCIKKVNYLEDTKEEINRQKGVYIERAEPLTTEGIKAICMNDKDYAEHCKKRNTQDTKGCGKYFSKVNVFCGDSNRPLCKECQEDRKKETLEKMNKNYKCFECNKSLNNCKCKEDTKEEVPSKYDLNVKNEVCPKCMRRTLENGKCNGIDCNYLEDRKPETINVEDMNWYKKGKEITDRKDRKNVPSEEWGEPGSEEFGGNR